LHTDAAAAWIQYVTAYVGIVEIANFKAGETMMINAPSSSVGIAAIQIAKMAGAKPVAITTSPEKSNVLLGLGAVAVFSPTDAELPKKIDDLKRRLRRTSYLRRCRRHWRSAAPKCCVSGSSPCYLRIAERQEHEHVCDDTLRKAHDSPWISALRGH
jgi:Zn-dependent alcohol dehydrogenase